MSRPDASVPDQTLFPPPQIKQKKVFWPHETTVGLTCFIKYEKIAGGNFHVKNFRVEIFSSSWVASYATKIF